MSNILQDLIVELRAEAAFNRSFVDGSRDRPAAASPGYEARRTELAEQREAWADAVETLLAAPPSSQPAAAPCKRCGATTAQACNDKGCFYLESGDGEPTAHAQADAREGLTDERRIELAIFHRILGRDGNGDATRSYGSKDDVLNLCRAIESEILAAHPGQPEPRAEVTEEQPSLTNPLTPYGMLVRALRIVSGTTLMDMAKALLTTPAKLSAMEFGRAPVTLDFALDVAAYFDALGVPDTLVAIRRAIDAARAGEAS
ncbi:helix-turn-helix domain-containing protein [Burkholderia cenocepacia]|uniref:helix-turn-helix domain-containing protein n=1 Tax=Burkholderia cenocepacia TaxID=95486 RepID=UPI002876C243|nr:helix-turn-helix domain-containing protein [Burkholderia cenocepacia]MDS0801760.1 helix-turn-helix domain-containing protein [Burkholderia cenocepacia]